MTPAYPKPDYKLARIRRAGHKPESEIQDACEAYAKWRGVETFHLPQILLNAAFRRRSILRGGEIWALRDAAHGIKGMPDLILFYRGHYRMVELKTEVGKLTHEQAAWLKRHDGVCIRSVDDFKRYLDEFVKVTDWLEGADYAVQN